LFELYNVCHITLTTKIDYCPKVLLTSEFLTDTMGAHLNERSPSMKKYSSIVHIVSLACAYLIFTGCTANQGGLGTAPAPANSGHLIVTRVANFGEDLSLTLSVDGKDVGSFTEGRQYSGYLPAGQHVLTARVAPNRTGTDPARKTLIVQAGQTYSYTAAWSGENLVLARNQ
jgi:hypothetical protein